MVNQVVANRPGMRKANAPGMIPDIGSRGVGKIRSVRNVIVENIYACGELLGLIEVVIQLQHVRIQTYGSRSVEGESGSIHAIADSRTVGRIFGSLSESCKRNRIYTTGIGKYLGNIICVDLLEDAVGILELHDALRQRGQRYCASVLRGLTCIATPLIAIEEEELVFQDGTADGWSESIADQSGSLQAGMIVEPIVRFKDRVAIEFRQHSMKVVSTAFGY